MVTSAQASAHEAGRPADGSGRTAEATHRAATPPGLAVPRRLTAALPRLGAALPGLAVTLLVGAAAVVAGRAVPVVGAPVIALLLGIGVRILVDHAPGDATGRLTPGAAFSGRYLLQAAIVLFGAGLSVSTVVRVGGGSLPVMLGTLTVCLTAAWLLGRALRIGEPLRTLIGSGTAICGASAISAVSPVLAASTAETAYAVSTIVVYNVLAAVLFPALGHLMGLAPHAFGLWAGTAVNDTSSVVATGYAYGAEAGRYAVVVKLTRSLMIVPVVLGLVALRARSRRSTDGPAASGSRPRLWRLVPPFILAFLLAAAVNSTGVLPAGVTRVLPGLAGYATAAAMGGVGFGTSPGRLRTAGLRPLALGGLLFVLTASSGLGLQALTGTLR